MGQRVGPHFVRVENDDVRFFATVPTSVPFVQLLGILFAQDLRAVPADSLLEALAVVVIGIPGQ